jgi:hypothetical protein
MFQRKFCESLLKPLRALELVHALCWYSTAVEQTQAPYNSTLPSYGLSGTLRSRVQTASFFSPDSHAASKRLSHRAPRPRLAPRLQEDATLTDFNPASLLDLLQTKKIPSTGNWSFYSWWEQQQQTSRWWRLETCCWSSWFLRFVQSEGKRSAWGKTVGNVVKARIPRAQWMDGWMDGWYICGQKTTPHWYSCSITLTRVVWWFDSHPHWRGSGLTSAHTITLTFLTEASLSGHVKPKKC